MSEQQFYDYQQYQWQSASPEHFAGNARFVRLPAIPNSADECALVEFETGAITDWHSHSQGQYLIVVSGEGRTQEWGKPIQTLCQGDVVWCPPNIKHWHGASESSRMAHIAISPNATDNHPTWLEKVSLPETSLNADLQKIRQNAPLADKQLALVAIAFHRARGELDDLKTAIAQGLDNGLTDSELREAFTHQYAYAGFPRALNGLQTLNNVLAERGIQPATSPTDSAPNSDYYVNYYALGTRRLNTLTQRDNSQILQNFDGVDYALKAHLFGYLFSREGLSAVNREIVTVSTLIALETVPNQLRSHLGILNNLGIELADLKKIIRYHQTKPQCRSTG